jgi:hypothetical protein
MLAYSTGQCHVANEAKQIQNMCFPNVSFLSYPIFLLLSHLNAPSVVKPFIPRPLFDSTLLFIMELPRSEFQKRKQRYTALKSKSPATSSGGDVAMPKSGVGAYVASAMPKPSTSSGVVPKPSAAPPKPSRSSLEVLSALYFSIE